MTDARTSSSVSVHNLRKTYVVPEREGGMKAAFTSLIHRKTKDVDAVKDISFEIPPATAR